MFLLRYPLCAVHRPTYVVYVFLTELLVLYYFSAYCDVSSSKVENESLRRPITQIFALCRQTHYLCVLFPKTFWGLTLFSLLIIRCHAFGNKPNPCD